MALTYDLLLAEEPEHAAARYVRALSAAVIILNVAAVMLESVQSINASWGRVLHNFDVASVIIFTLEYLLRLWSSPAAAWVEGPDAAHDGIAAVSPTRARLRYVFSFFGIIDLLAIAPFYLQAFFVSDLRIVRALRLLRLERLFLLGRYSKGLHMLGRAVKRTKHELYASFAVIAMMLLITSSIVYFIEHETQPDKFSNIPESLWWGVITLTSVGYGDVYPMTPLGKLFGGIISLLGLGLAALPSGLIASGFVQEFKEERETMMIAEGHVVCPICNNEFKVVEGGERRPTHTPTE